MLPIVPAIIPRSSEEVKSLLSRLDFSPEIHLDVVDGKFVPFTSWPYEPIGSPSEIMPETDKFTLEVDLMVNNPIVAAKDWMAAGADMLVFHVESINLETFKHFIQETSISIGVSALNDTPLETLLPYVGLADYVQLMGIAKIGSQGQDFDKRVLARIAAIKQNFPKQAITIDGSVNKDTAVLLKEAGADRLVVGSAIISATNPLAAYLELTALV